MKPWIKILFISISLLVIVFACLYVFLIFQGKALVIKKLEDLTRRKVSIGYFDLKPPLNLEIKSLNIDGLAKIENIFISPSVPSLFTGNLGFNKVRIIKPEITLEKIEPKKDPAGASAAPAAVSAPAAAPGKEEVLNSSTFVSDSSGRRKKLLVKSLSIKEGKVYYIDNHVGKEGIRITFEDVNFQLSNLYSFPFSAVTNFDLSARIPWREGEEQGKIDVSGWINFAKRDMQAKVNINDIDGIYLYPYYSQWVDLEKARIEKANLNFSSNIKGVDNNVTAKCHLELSNIMRTPRTPEDPQLKEEKLTDTVLDMFRAQDQGRIVLDFTIPTKMDNPIFSFKYVTMAFEDKIVQARRSKAIKIRDVVTFPGKMITDTVKSAANVSRAVIDGTVAIGSEVTKSVGSTLSKEQRQIQ